MPYNIIDPIEYGFHTNAINLFTTEKIIQVSPKTVEEFLQASKKGWEYALSHTEEVAELIHKKYRPSVSTEHLLYEGKITKELILPKMYAIGEINRDFVMKQYERLVREGKIFASKDSSKLIYVSQYALHQQILKLTDQEKVWLKKHPELSGVEINYTYVYLGAGTFLLLLFAFLLKQRDLRKHNWELYTIKERLELALRGSKSGVWDWDKEKDALYISPQWKEMLGFSDDELENSIQTWLDRIYPEDKEKIMQAVENGLSQKLPYGELIYRLVNKDGSNIWIHSWTYTSYNDAGVPLRVIGTHMNITADKARALKLQQQTQIIEQIHDGVISTDMQGSILSFNHGAELILGQKREEMLNTYVTDIFYAEDRAKVIRGIEILKVKGEYHDVLRLMREDEKILYSELSLSKLEDENGVMIGVIGFFQDITQRYKAQQELLEQKNELNFQAHHDSLTALPNRALFKDRLSQALKKAERTEKKVALLFIDLDHFKEINDSLGHGVGDKVLVEVGKRLRETIRNEDILARLGGDEFTIVFEDLEEDFDLVPIAKKLIANVVEPIVVGEHTLYVSCSIGISFYPNDGQTSEDLLKFADAAMYKAKDEGRNSFQFYSKEMTEYALERVTMEAQLRTALENEEFIAYYQPQVDGRTGEILGAEALVRWQHPVMGLLSPAKFISMADATGLIVELDRYVMHSAMLQFSEWYKEGLIPGILSINLTMKQLYKEDFLDVLQECLDDTECLNRHLELEILEDQLMKDPEKAIKVLNAIKKKGISLAIDDFGTGYSSLAYLKRLPISKLKIDKSFVDDLPNDDEDVTITKTIIALAKSLHLELLAEGVEREEQKDFLLENGCNVIQGYYYSKPVSAKEMHKLLQKERL